MRRAVWRSRGSGFAMVEEDDDEDDEEEDEENASERDYGTMRI
jgi:hypothetical protein